MFNSTSNILRLVEIIYLKNLKAVCIQRVQLKWNCVGRTVNIEKD